MGSKPVNLQLVYIPVCLFNRLLFIFQICGAGLLGIGLWMKFDPMISHYLHIVDVAATNSLIDVAGMIHMEVLVAPFKA